MKNRKSNRLKGYDYSKNNLYFVTSCVKNMECCLGDVVGVGIVGTGRDLSVHNSDINNSDINNSDINNSDINNSDKNNSDKNEGEMILNKYGIIVKNQLEWIENQYPYISLHSYIVMPNHIHAVIEIDSILIKSDPVISVQSEVVKIKSLSQIIGAFKTTSSKFIHQSGYDDFAWHRSFHDHIIRNEKSFFNILNYIENNPSTWYLDKFYKK